MPTDWEFAKMKCRFTLFLVSFITANVALAVNPEGPIHWETS